VCLLNPAIFHGENSKVDTNNEILTYLYVPIERLVPDPDENDYVREELNMYIDSGGQFRSDSDKRTRTKFAPYIWWRSYGIDTSLLQRFAIITSDQVQEVKKERYRYDDDEISVGGGLEEEVNALEDLDLDAEPLDCN
nr:zinc finger protein [Tanacetum cinerariifolium]